MMLHRIHLTINHHFTLYDAPDTDMCVCPLIVIIVFLITIEMAHMVQGKEVSCVYYEAGLPTYYSKYANECNSCICPISGVSTQDFFNLRGVPYKIQKSK